MPRLYSFFRAWAFLLELGGLVLNIEYLNQAKARVPNIPVLVNLVSRRVRQLNSGQRPLVKPDSPHMERLDLVLKEIAMGKLDAELVAMRREVSDASESFRRLFND